MQYEFPPEEDFPQPKDQEYFLTEIDPRKIRKLMHDWLEIITLPSFVISGHVDSNILEINTINNTAQQLKNIKDIQNIIVQKIEKNFFKTNEYEKEFIVQIPDSKDQVKLVIQKVFEQGTQVFIAVLGLKLEEKKEQVSLIPYVRKVS